MTTLKHAETLLVEGADALAFAHAQFSSNVHALASEQWQFSAWLDPQGRVKNFFHLARLADDRLLLLLRGGSAADMAESLQRFVFRSRVTLLALAPRSLRTGPAIPLGAFSEPDAMPIFGCGLHSLQLTDDDVCEDAWRRLQLREGWPWIPVALLNTLLSSSLSLQRLQAAVIDKGCYPGQEIVARMHFRGGHKKHLHRVELSLEKIPGEIVRWNAQEKGCLLDVVCSEQGNEALAVLNDDLIPQVSDRNLPPMDHGLFMRILETWPA